MLPFVFRRVILTRLTCKYICMFIQKVADQTFLMIVLIMGLLYLLVCQIEECTRLRSGCSPNSFLCLKMQQQFGSCSKGRVRNNILPRPEQGC